MDANEVGRRIKQIRKNKGLNQTDFAKRIGATLPAVSNWETGKNLPNNERLKAIADIGNLTVDELLHGKLGVKIHDSTHLRIIEPLQLQDTVEYETQIKYEFSGAVELTRYELGSSIKKKDKYYHDELQIVCNSRVEVYLYIPLNRKENHYFHFFGVRILNDSPYSGLFEESALDSMKEYLVNRALSSEELSGYKLNYDDFSEYV